MQRHAEQASDFLKAIANAHRLKIMCMLIDGERTVSELCAALGEGTKQSVVSQHLARLRLEKLVDARRAGKQTHYSLRHPAAKPVLTVLYDAFCNPPETPARAPLAGE